MSTIISDTPTAHAKKATTTSSRNRDGSESSHSPILGHFMAMEDLAVDFKREPSADIDDSEIETILPDRPRIRLVPTEKLIPTTIPTDSDTPKKKFVCPYESCTKSYGKSSHLRSHLTWHTGIKPFVCNEPGCGKGFTRSDELNRHVRTHTGEKPFECVQCTKKFSRSDHLTKHLATHAKQMEQKHGDKPISTTKIKNQSQEPAKKRVLRASAPKRPLSPFEPEVEAKKIGLNTNQMPSAEIADAPETEPVPMDNFHFMAAMLGVEQEPSPSHAENLADDDDEYEAFPQPIKIKLERPDESGDYHVVPSKGARNDDDGYDEDDEIEALEDNAIMPEANVAIQPNYTKSDDPARPFLCAACPKTFRRHDDHTRHWRTHTGEKPFECAVCPKRFNRSDHLKKHTATHTRVKVNVQKPAHIRVVNHVLWGNMENCRTEGRQVEEILGGPREDAVKRRKRRVQERPKSVQERETFMEACEVSLEEGNPMEKVESADESRENAFEEEEHDVEERKDVAQRGENGSEEIKDNNGMNMQNSEHVSQFKQENGNI